MHPEDDQELSYLFEIMEKELEENKKRYAEFKEKIDMLRGALKVLQVPESYQFAIDSAIMLVEQVGQNRANIEKTQYWLFKMMEGMNKKISHLNDTVAGLGKHR